MHYIYFVHLIVVCWELSHLIFALKFNRFLLLRDWIWKLKFKKNMYQIVCVFFSVVEYSFKNSITLSNCVFTSIYIYIFANETKKMRIYFHDDILSWGYLSNCMQPFQLIGLSRCELIIIIIWINSSNFVSSLFLLFFFFALFTAIPFSITWICFFLDCCTSESCPNLGKTCCKYAISCWCWPHYHNGFACITNSSKSKIEMLTF